MDSYKKKELRKDMHFRLDPVLGKADVKYKEERLYLQIKIEIPDTLRRQGKAGTAEPQ